MKITKRHLRRIIRSEIGRIDEQGSPIIAPAPARGPIDVRTAGIVEWDMDIKGGTIVVTIGSDDRNFKVPMTGPLEEFYDCSGGSCRPTERASELNDVKNIPDLMSLGFEVDMKEMHRIADQAVRGVTGKQKKIDTVVQDAMDFNKGKRDPAINVEDADAFNVEVLKNPGTVLVDFWATWCQPCKKADPILKMLSVQNGFRLVKVDVDKSPGLKDDYSVEVMPTLLIFKNGKEVERIRGWAPEAYEKIKALK